MVKYNVCIVDDQIPVIKQIDDETGRLSSQILTVLLRDKETSWRDDALKNLLTDLLNQPDDWVVSAFKNPNFYLNNLSDDVNYDDFIIFDWDYGATADDPATLLKEILQKSFSIIFIFTLTDKKDEITTLINTSLSEYNNRISIFYKSDEDSIKKLQETAKSMEEKNFAFKFGKELRFSCASSLESILIEFGKTDIENIIRLFGELKENNFVLEPKELTEIIVEKLRNVLIDKNFGQELPPILNNVGDTIAPDIVRKMWSYRLYYRPTDNLVRKGDIIRKADADLDSDILYLVIASDCHLNTFWKKNLGSLPLVPLYRVHVGNEALKKKMQFNASNSELKKKLRFTSLTNTDGIDGPTSIPCIPTQENTLFDYLIFPRDITNIQIPHPNAVINRSLRLNYDHIENFDGLGRLCISEPFLTPLVQHIISNITGHGVPDFSTSLMGNIKTNFEGLFN